MRIAVVGGGIAGLGAAYLLSKVHVVDLFEREPRLGGHAHTHRVGEGPNTQPVDTGFLVYNTRTYPHFSKLLEELGVRTSWSDMSFSVRCRRCRLEYASRSFDALFAQRRRLFDPRHWMLLRGLMQFFGAARRFLSGTDGYHVSLGEFWGRARLPEHVARHFVLPMTGAIWSASFRDMLAHPARAILQFLDNHGLLSPVGAPRWRTIDGGSERYVEALSAHVSGRVARGTTVASVRRTSEGATLGFASGSHASYDKVVIATHADEALAMLDDPTSHERDLLGRFRYSSNHTWLHTDARVLPERRRAWASWNCDIDDCYDRAAPVALTYHINRLQNIPGPVEYCVTLNPRHEMGGRVLARMTYTHPVFDARTVAAQQELMSRNGQQHTYFCGAYLGHGFHEDGFVSARRVAALFGACV